MADVQQEWHLSYTHNINLSGAVPIKERRSKSEIRESLELHTSRFLSKGGNVRVVPQGESGYVQGEEPSWLHRPVFVSSPTKRTPVNDIVMRVEERRATNKKRAAKPKSTTPISKEKLIYDDFGEPIRKIWIYE